MELFFSLVFSVSVELNTSEVFALLLLKKWKKSLVLALGN